MDTLPITWGVAAAFGAILIAVASGFFKMAMAIRGIELSAIARADKDRQAADAARARIYERIEAALQKNDDVYVRKDVLDAHIIRLLQAFEETQRQLNEVASRGRGLRRTRQNLHERE